MDEGVLFNFFGNIADELPSLIAEATEYIAEEAVNNVQARIEDNGQIETGEMYDSVDHVDNGDGSQTVFVGAPYAIYPNYGTRFQPANPFWEPGLDDTKDAMDEALQNLASAIEELGK